MRKKKKNKETLKDSLDKLEVVEHVDWVGDLKRREYKKSKEYLNVQKLAEKFKKKKK